MESRIWEREIDGQKYRVVVSDNGISWSTSYGSGHTENGYGTSLQNFINNEANYRTIVETCLGEEEYEIFLDELKIALNQN